MLRDDKIQLRRRVLSGVLAAAIVGLLVLLGVISSTNVLPGLVAAALGAVTGWIVAQAYNRLPWLHRTPRPGTLTLLFFLVALLSQMLPTTWLLLTVLGATAVLMVMLWSIPSQEMDANA